MNRVPRALIIGGDSLGGARETALGFRLARFEVEIKTLESLIRERPSLDQISNRYHAIAIPGGFSFGDHLGAGKVLSIKIRHGLMWNLSQFVQRGGLVLGIGNGFQALLRLGVFGRDISITQNSHGRFLNEWTRLLPVGNRCIWIRGMGNLDLPVRHSEGRILISSTSKKEVWARMQRLGMACLRYEIDLNGSEENIAGVCDSTGRIFGLMPHPENFLRWTQHPEWTFQSQRSSSPGQGLMIFENAYQEVLRSL